MVNNPWAGKSEDLIFKCIVVFDLSAGKVPNFIWQDFLSDWSIFILLLLSLNSVNCHLTNQCAPEVHFVRVQFCNFTWIRSWGLANVSVYHLKCFVTLYENHKKSSIANSKSRERSDFSGTYFLKVHFPSNNKVCFDSSDLTIFFTKLIFLDNWFLFSFF